MNVRKFGEASPMVTPSQAEQSEGVESRHGLSSTDKGVLQTTNRNGDENRSGKKIPRLMACGFNSRAEYQSAIVRVKYSIQKELVLFLL